MSRPFRSQPHRPSLPRQLHHEAEPFLQKLKTRRNEVPATWYSVSRIQYPPTPPSDTPLYVPRPSYPFSTPPHLVCIQTSRPLHPQAVKAAWSQALGAPLARAASLAMGTSTAPPPHSANLRFVGKHAFSALERRVSVRSDGMRARESHKMTASTEGREGGC
ncbi:hypothetical protein EJ04DRAFT_362470 [Polyplosphaeria fusca]|uniref:Uncharacterized protein n=1 Tax=Polyplosphaeria fusca TaxID=682080 RepID=A0A9P4QSB1_9PLEO|nr:hypothetical protein EJ04DRAFT_362470 [Polyplosphaeria fusca]